MHAQFSSHFAHSLSSLSNWVLFQLDKISVVIWQWVRKSSTESKLVGHTKRCCLLNNFAHQGIVPFMKIRKPKNTRIRWTYNGTLRKTGQNTASKNRKPDYHAAWTSKLPLVGRSAFQWNVNCCQVKLKKWYEEEAEHVWRLSSLFEIKFTIANTQSGITLEYFLRWYIINYDFGEFVATCLR